MSYKEICFPSYWKVVDRAIHEISCALAMASPYETTLSYTQDDIVVLLTLTLVPPQNLPFFKHIIQQKLIDCISPL